MFRKTVALVLVLMLAAACCVSYAEGFSFRGGIRFGMSPEEVISIEESNGYYYDRTSSGDILYDAGYSYQLYYQHKDIGSVGTLPIMRFEYDFDPDTMEMYQFYYVFKEDGAYNYLAPMLAKKYGEPDNSASPATEKYGETGETYHTHHSRWVLEYEGETVVIDLWDNDYNTCFLTYQGFNARDAMEEQESLEFCL